MAKVTDLKAYYRELATKAGLDAKIIEQVESAFDNKTFTDGFMPLPSYSHDLDDVRAKTEAKVKTDYQDWHDKEVKKFENNDRIWRDAQDKLRRYEDTYGQLDVTNPPPANDRREGNMTKEQIEELVATKARTLMDETLSRRDSTVLDLLEVREFHMEKFKKSLDTKAFEAAWKDHPEWGGSLKQAYKNYIEPDVQKMQEDANKAFADQRYQEGLRDGASRRGLPTDNGAKIFSPVFERNADIDKMTEAQQEAHSREAFFAGLNEKMA